MWFAGNVMIIALVLAGAVALQFLLSRVRSRWPGLILPGLSVLISLIALLRVGYYMALRHVLLQGTLVLVVFNIPTVVYLAIYWSVRDQLRQKLSEEEKMHIHDLD